MSVFSFLLASISILKSELLFERLESDIAAYLSLSHASDALEINSLKKTSFSLYKE